MAGLAADLATPAVVALIALMRVPGYSIYQRPHKPQRIEIAGEFLAHCMPL
jgi:hypothetical protein